MTKKDYILIANVLKPYFNLDSCYKQHEAIIKEMTFNLERALKKDNPRFSEEKFNNYFLKQ